MSIKIIATKVDEFSKIEGALGKFDTDFISKFDTAEYAVEGFKDIKLVSEYFFRERIRLPKGFAIEDIETQQYSEYEKDTEGSIKETQKYKIVVRGMFENLPFVLIYLNIMNINIKIGL